MADSSADAVDHAFWSTQPVIQSDEATASVVVGPMDQPKTVDDVSKEPLALASTFEWWTPNLASEEDLTAVYELLRDNYVEDNDSMFRFNYSQEFLRWALTPPDFIPDWHVAVRHKKTGKLLAFIAGVPMTMRMGVPKTTTARGEASAEDSSVDTHREPRHICEINFLCVHKQLRDKRLAPILIKEVTRRVNLRNIWQAIYTAGVVLPTPFSDGQYWHRSLNPEKLVAVRFSGIPPRFKKFENPMAMMKRYYKLDAQPHCKTLRPMTESDVPQVKKLLADQLSKYSVAPVFTESEVRHYLLPRRDVVFTCVNDKDGKILDFFSFYSLPSTIIGNSKYNLLNAAYLHYYAATSMPLPQLIKDMLVVAVKEGFDVCNMVEILENKSFTSELLFGPGDGYLHYYFYNWAYPKIPPTDVGLVML